MLTKSGPGDLLSITKNASKNQENVGTSWGNIIFVDMGTKKHDVFHLLHMYRLLIFVGGELSISVLYYIFWRWGSGNDEDLFNNIYKSLDITFISIKNMKCTFDNVYEISFKNIKHLWNQEVNTKTRHFLYVQVREIPQHDINVVFILRLNFLQNIKKTVTNSDVGSGGLGGGASLL